MMKFRTAYLFFISSLTMLLAACNIMQKNKPVFTWEQFAMLPNVGGASSLGYAGPVTGIHNNALIVGGGTNFPVGMPWSGGKKKYYDVAYVLDIKNKQAGFKEFKLPFTVGYSAVASTIKGVVSVGGEDENGPIEKAFLIKWENGSLLFETLPNLPLKLTNAAATVIDNQVYIAGGETNLTASSFFLKLDLDNKDIGWQELKEIPKAVSHFVLLTTGNGKKIYLIGGRKKTETGISELYNSLYEYDVEKNIWNAKSPLPYNLCAGTGAIVNGQYIALFGGDKGTTFHKTEQLINAINTEQDSIKKQMLNKEKRQLQQSHPGFSNEILLYDIANDKWVTGGDIPFYVAVTTTAITVGNNVWVPSGEIKAGVRTPQILRATIK
ncbi:MAG: hypothetical protein ACK5NK_00715 [Niabella sp.]